MSKFSATLYLCWLGASIAALAYIVLQSVGSTRNGFAAQMMKPIPAFYMALICLSNVKPPCCSKNVRSRGLCHGVERRPLFFTFSLLCYAAGDVLLGVRDAAAAADNSGSSNSSEEEAPLLFLWAALGVASFAAGHLILIAALCLSVRSVRPPFTPLLALLYGIAGAGLWLLVSLGASLGCGCPSAAAILTGLYMAIVTAVCWRAADWAIFRLSPRWPDWLLVGGAHLFLASDCLVTSWTLCGVPRLPAVYYPLAMASYYAAIFMETAAICAPARPKI